MASLDGLRGVACLAIFVFHGWLYTMPTPQASARDGVGEYAVHELRLALVSFFVLSGFLLYRPWVKAALGGRSRPDLRVYVRARVARIAPAYYAALIGSIVLLWGLSGTTGLRLPPAGELPLFFVFAQNFSPNSVLKLNPPMWSLAVEVCFYAVLPLLGWLAVKLPRDRRAQALVPLALVAGGILFNWSIAGESRGLTFSKTLPAVAPYFGVGMLAALLLHGRTPGQSARRAMVAGGMTLVAADAFVKAIGPAGAFDPFPWFSIFRDLPSGIGFALITAYLASSLKGGVLSGRVLAGMGTISYGFYLWHVPVLLFLRGHGLLPLDPVLGTLVALGPALAVATLSWFALERPAIRWAARRNGRARREREATLRRGADGRAGGREVGTVRA
ncbi:MAG: acyltransferase [Solirubrobacterales bacterium]|nr:acyltransferase [Solirubrobacterales bacterium]